MMFSRRLFQQFRAVPRSAKQLRLYGGFNRRTPNYIYFGGQKTSGGFKYSNLTPQQKRILMVLGVFISFEVVTHIEEAPVTHRYRLMLTAEWIENMVTDSSFNQVMSQYGRWVLPDSHPISRQVRKIMTRLIGAAHDYVDPETGEHTNLFTYLGKSDIPLDKWEFYVIDDVSMGQPTPNAFVIGGGKVFIFRSILPICEDETGMATVLSHELGHLLADHLGEKLSKSPFLFTLNIILYSIFGSAQPGDILVNLLLDSSFSREMETEADYIGMMVMSRACYDPRRAPRLWKNMINFEKKNGQRIPEILSSHPSSDRRFENLYKWMPKAEMQYEKAGCSNYSNNFNLFKFM